MEPTINVKELEEFALGIVLAMVICALFIIFIILKVANIVASKNKDINIKDQVINIQKEIIEHQPKVLTRNHDN